MNRDMHPTVLHITHWKAGSQWIYAFLDACAHRRMVVPEIKVAHFLENAIIPGKIYPTVYVTYEQYRDTISPEVNLDASSYRRSSNDPAHVTNWYNFQVRHHSVRAFLVIRDLRDTLISWYFSMLASHPVLDEHMAKVRVTLNDLSQEQGLLYVLRNKLHAAADIQRSWWQAVECGDVALFRYEDLLLREQECFAELARYCNFELPERVLHEVIERNSFSSRSGGRKLGEKDAASHLRQGAAGDWRNYFTDVLKHEFKTHCGDLLVETGYEKDLSW